MSEDFTGTIETNDDQQDISTQTDTNDQSTDTSTQNDGTQADTSNVDASSTQADAPLSGKALRDAVKSASEAFPEQSKAFKTLADAHFREQAYKAAFPTTQEAVQAKSIIESVGGLDGIAKIQERISSYDQQDEALSTGNPAVLDAMFKDFPEGAAALAPHYLERLARSNPDAFTNSVAPYVIGMLDNAGVGAHLSAILNEADPAKAKALVQQLAQWYGGQVQSVRQIMSSQQSTAKNPQSDKLNKERESIQTEKEELFKSTVSEKVNSTSGVALNSEVDKYAKQYKLTDTQKEHFKKTLQQAIVDDMSADQSYLKQLNLRMSNKARTYDSVSGFISAEVGRRLKTKAFEVVKSIYGAPKSGTVQNTTGVVKAGAPKTASSGGPLYVSQKPDPSEFADYDGLELDIINGRARLRNGRFVTWRKSN